MKKTATSNNAAAQAESEARKAQAKENNAAAAGAICENAEAKSEEVERMCQDIMSDSVVTANETGGWHRVRSILSTASEDEDHIAFNNDHIKHDMNENEKSAGVTGEEHLDRDTVNDDADNVETAKEVGGRRRGRLVLRIVNEENDFTVFHNDLVEHNTDDGMGETKKIKHNQEEVKAHPQKPRRLSPWRLQGSQVMNIPIETQQKWKQIASRVMVTTLGSHNWSLRQVLSCYMLATTWTKFFKNMMKTVKTVRKKARQQQMRMKRYQRKTLKSEDSSNSGEVHPKKRNNNWKK